MFYSTLSIHKPLNFFISLFIEIDENFVLRWWWYLDEKSKQNKSSVDTYKDSCNKV